MGTTAFDMKESLIARAKALPELSALNADNSIWDSAYSETYRPRQLLWFGEVVWADDRNVAFGKHPTTREEEYNIRFGIEINDHDTDQSDANAKAKVIMQAIENMCSGDLRDFGIGGLVVVGVVPVGIGEGPGGAEGGRATYIAAQVNVRARK